MLFIFRGCKTVDAKNMIDENAFVGSSTYCE